MARLVAVMPVAPSMTWLLVRTRPAGSNCDAGAGPDRTLVAEVGVDVDQSRYHLAQQGGLIKRRMRGDRGGEGLSCRGGGDGQLGAGVRSAHPGFRPNRPRSTVGCVACMPSTLPENRRKPHFDAFSRRCWDRSVRDLPAAGAVSVAFVTASGLAFFAVRCSKAIWPARSSLPPVQLLIAGTLMVSLAFGAAFIVLHRTKDLRGPAVETGSPAHRRAEPGAGASHRPAIRRGRPPAGSQRELSADALPRGGRTDLQGLALPQLRSPDDPGDAGLLPRDRAQPLPRRLAGGSSTRASPGWEDAEQRRSRGGVLPPSRRSGPRCCSLRGRACGVADHRMDHIGFVDVTSSFFVILSL